MWNRSKNINSIASILAIVLLYLFVPKNKIRDATFIFLLKQSLTWLFGLLVAEQKLIQYPVRFFSYATRASFTFEYIVYPAISIWFNFTYPRRKSFINGLLHNGIFTSAITGLEIILNKYTNVIKYNNWAWYWTWLTIFVINSISRLSYVWFFKHEHMNKQESSEKVAIENN